MKKERLELVLKTAQHAMAGVLSGPMFTQVLFKILESGQRTALGNTMMRECWDMADYLVSIYEEQLHAEEDKLHV